MSVPEATPAGAAPAAARLELWERVHDALRERRHEPVFLTGRRVLRGAEVARRLEQAAHLLGAGGVGPGSVALLAVRPGVEAFVATLALVRLGATATPMDPGAGPELFRSRIRLLRPSAVVAESLLYAASARGPFRRYLRGRGLELPDLRAIPARHFRLGPWLPGCPTASVRLDARPRPDDVGPGAIRLPGPGDLGPEPALVVFTSGTTGRPKGVQHSPSSALATVLAIREHLHVDRDAVLLNYTLHSLLAAVLAGVPTRIAPLRPRPGPWLEVVRRHRVTTAFLRPSEAARVVAHCERTGVVLPGSLQTLYLYSAPVTDAFLERLHAVARDGFRAFTVYGMTEALPVAWADSRKRLRRGGDGDWVGWPVPELELRVGPSGTLQLRGPTVHQGYLGEAPVEWHDTGDLARLEPDGSLTLLGRAKDMILRDGLNI
ncbi:MAG: AMP-binding protein [Longimicrobiales bacterium]